MFSLHTFSSFARQLARLVPNPTERSRAKAKAKGQSHFVDDGCGCCPLCGEFVYVEFSEAEQATLCPRCDQPIESLDALGSA